MKGIRMCTDENPAEQSRPEAQTFATTAEFLAAIQPGMHLCSSDFNGWGVVESVDTAAPAVVGVTNADQRRVRVPADTLIDIRGGHCVRIDRVRATLDGQGWEI
ncbi:hypothetical protein BST29_11655 [Mycobacterium malmoense]|uniref:Uncharacterized protein n=2 Tax=Mycobacterium malmoense TaxID=1780 RepID=A0ABX3SS35_MYCMA|nr:hypothetical protein BST29_11655 [Mycobacterium malmoense]